MTMNLREIKIALTVDLMNQVEPQASIASVQHAMSRYQTEVGSFVGSTEKNGANLGDGLWGKTIALHFENLTLDLDLVTNIHSSEQMIQGFNLKENFA
jgi:hypothetical protein